MVPLPSHSLTQWGQLGAILGGVKFPEQTAMSGFAAALAWGLANNSGEKSKYQNLQGALCPKTECSPFDMRP